MSVAGVLNTLSPFVNRRAKSYCKGTLCLIKKKGEYDRHPFTFPEVQKGLNINALHLNIQPL